MQTTARKPTNLTLDYALLMEAKQLGINLSQAAEAGLKRAVLTAKTEQWKHENSMALQSSNKWVEQNGMPLEKYRQF